MIEERAWIAQSIKERIKNGATPASIAVLARRHQDLVSLLPYLYHEDIAVNYERRDNVLDIEAVRALELLARITVSLHDSEFDVVDSLMPQLLGHPMCKPNPEAIWRLGLTCYRDRITWLEAMQNSEYYHPLAPVSDTHLDGDKRQGWSALESAVAAAFAADNATSAKSAGEASGAAGAVWWGWWGAKR